MKNSWSTISIRALLAWPPGRPGHQAGGTIAVSLAMVMLLDGCGLSHGAFGPDARLIRGIEPRVEDISFAEAAALQDKLIDALKEQAQLGGITLAPRDLNWSLVLKAGLQVVDGRCDQYLDVLFRFNREQRAARKGLTAGTAATASIMGLAGAAGQAVSIVATALGLATALFDANVDSVLFQVEPSALRNVVIQGRQKYIADLLSRTDRLRTIDTRPDMMIALQGYLTQCSPAAIEANINNAANGSPFAVTLPATIGQTEPGTGGSSVVTGTPSVQLVGRASNSLSQNVLVAPPPRPRQDDRSPINIPGAERLDRGSSARILAALGVGRPDATLRVTAAIAEAQRAVGRRDARWLAEPRGTLEGPLTRGLLLSVGPMPAQFHTPFERFLLGDRVGTTQPDGTRPGAYATLDRTEMVDLRDLLGLPADDLPAGFDLWSGVRPALETVRRTASLGAPVALDAGIVDRAALDADLYERILLGRRAPAAPAGASQ